jgi:sortase system peptidoglycan-associated protein
MKKQLIATSIILSLAMAPVMASSTTTESDVSSDNTNEIIGLSTGAVIGGLIAGPIGLIVAGTIGLFIGHSQEQKDQIEQVETHLVNNKVAMESLSNDKQVLEQRLAQSEQTQHLLIEELALTEKTLSQADKLEQLKLNLQFDIDSAQVESFYTPQIKHLAMMMQENPELSVNLSGYSDPSGSEKSNLKLSQARIESVKLMLVNLGVDENYINTEAFGESHSMQANRTASSNFNERRVDVQLFAQEQVIISEHKVTAQQVAESKVPGIEEIEALESEVAKQQVIVPKHVIAQTQILADIN